MGNSSDDKLTPREYRDLIIEAGMQAIPYVGGSLATIYFGQKQEIRFKRLESFYSELNKEIGNIKSIIPDISKHNQEELNAIIEELHEKIEAENIQIKRNYYKQYYKSTLYNPVNGNYDERKLFLDILSEITPLQIELIIFLSTKTAPVIGTSITKPSVEEATIQGSISQLKNHGIIEGYVSSIVVGGPGRISENVSLTTFGRKFHQFCLV